MHTLEEDIRIAKSLGLSYGQYKAQTYSPGTTMPKSRKRKSPPRRVKRYTDEEAFALWQAGKTDAEIGEVVGVSRQVIQNWRDNLELPSTHKIRTNTQKYRLAKRQDGTYYVFKSDCLF